MNNLQQYLELLGVGSNATDREIRRAYASKLKQIDLEIDPAAFQTLQEAYQALMEWSRRAEDADFPATGTSAPQPEQEAPIAPTVPAPELMDAEKLFDETLARFADLPAKGEKSLENARRIMHAAMQQPALIHIESRQYFEWCVVRRLAQGWQPGNEWLFETALEVFDWTQSEIGLTRFEQAGAIINAALAEWEFFNHQQQQERQEQLEILQELRVGKDRELDWILYRRDRLDLMVARFPTLIELLSDAERLVSWLSEIAQSPKWRRIAVTAAAVQKTVIIEDEEVKESQAAWGWTVFIFVLVVMAYNTFKDPLLKWRHGESQQSGGHAPYVAIPEGEELEKQFSGSASIGGCNDARKLGTRAVEEQVEYRLGPAYHRYIQKCVEAGYR